MSADRPPFDRFVVVDWSAAGQPTTGADSVWIADLAADADESTFHNPRTRRVAAGLLDEIVGRARDRGERTLLAIDVALGFPAGSAAAFGIGVRDPDLDVDEAAWSATWAWVAHHLTDDERNRNDRFDLAARLNGRVAEAGPFWGCPPSRNLPTLTTTKPDVLPLPEYRTVDRRLREGGRHPFSVWQLLGVGSVGSQTLTALPVVRHLVARHRAQVWPFTTGLEPPEVERSGVVLAEVWPSGIELDIPIHWVRDAGQVDGVARVLRAADRDGSLLDWWRPVVDDADLAAVVDEEGWVLGVT